MSEVATPGVLRDITDSAVSSSWRERIRTHSAADLFPPMSEAELEQLGIDIKMHGLREPVVFSEDGKLLDGRNRLDAMERVGLPILDDTGKFAPCFKTVWDADPFEYVVSANYYRRHLTAEQRDDVIRKLNAQQPELSVRRIAAATHTSKSTVARALAEPAVPSGTPERVTGRDGKSYPAKTPSTRKPRTAPAQVRDKVINGLSVLLGKDLRKTLEDLVRLLGNEGPQIKALPLEKRVALAQDYLRALGVDPNDLRPDEGSL